MRGKSLENVTVKVVPVRPIVASDRTTVALAMVPCTTGNEENSTCAVKSPPELELDDELAL